MERVYGLNFESEESKEQNLLYAAARPGIVFPAELVITNVADHLDQGQKGSCTAHGIIGNYMTGERKLGLTEWLPSTLGLYYDEREREGTTNRDAGAIIKDGIIVANTIGLGPASLWPYIEDKFTIKPPPEYYAAAKKNRIKYYANVLNTSLENLKLPILHGNPVTFGMRVYPNFERYTGGVLQKPGLFDRYLGGHCMYYFGYSDQRQAFKVRNSWGNTWGEQGDIWISYDYFLSNLVSDLWVIRLA